MTIENDTAQDRQDAAPERKEEARAAFDAGLRRPAPPAFYEKFIEYFFSSDVYSLYLYGTYEQTEKAVSYLKSYYASRCESEGKTPSILVASAERYHADLIAELLRPTRELSMEPAKYRACEVLVLTELDKASGKLGLQEQLYELVDYHERQRTHKVVVTASVPVRDLVDFADRNVSQLQGGIICRAEYWPWLAGE